MTSSQYRVVYSAEDYTVFQTHLLLSHLKLDDVVTIHRDVTLDPAAKGMQLQAADGQSVSPRIAVFRHLASRASGSWLGASADQSSVIDHWIDFSWHQLGEAKYI